MKNRYHIETRRFAFRAVAIAVLALALVPTSLFAQERTITSLPYTVTSADNGYTLRLGSSHMTCTDRAITFNSGVHDVILDLETDTITWGTAGNEGTMGIFLAGNPVYNVTIQGGYVIHEPPASATVPSVLLRAQAVRLGGGNHDIVIDGVYFRVAGRNSQIIRNESGGNPGTYNVEIKNCRFHSFMESFTSREMWIDAAMVALGNNDYKDGSGFNYHFDIHNNTTINAHWCNIYLQGANLVARVHDNYMMSDARNDLGTGFPTSAAQCYALSFRGGGGGCRVDCYNNTIRSGTAYAGGRGIFISGVDGEGLEEDNSIYIHDNDIEVHQGFDGEEHTLNGILVRQGWTNVYLRNNIVTCIGDTDAGTSSYEAGPLSCLRLTGYGEGLKIVGNTLKTYFTSSYSPDYSMVGPFGACIMFDEFQMDIPNVTIDSNTMETDNLGIRWGFFNGQGGNVTLRDNTYRYLDGQGDYVFYLGYGAGGSHHAYGNVDIDGQFVNGADATDIYVDDGEPDSLSICLQATLSVTVMGNNAQTVSNAVVKVTNGYGRLVASGTSGASGLFTSPVAYWYEANDTFSGGDSTDYNSFTIEVSKNGDTTTTSLSVSPTSKNPTVTLENTAGDTGTSDVTPPASIMDLGANCDSEAGGVILTWTATGDDGNSGQAAYYDLRYSTSRISAANFNSATAAQNLPTPKPSGQSESYSMTLPQATATYYFAIKAFDEVGLGSSLDDPIVYSAGSIQAPAIDTLYVDENNRLVTPIVIPAPSCAETYFEFQVDEVSTFASPMIGVDSTATDYASYTFAGLLDNTIYYWRSRAVAADGSSSSSWTIPQGFMPFVTFSTGCDDVALFSPEDGANVGSASVTLTVENANDESQNVYFFEVSDDPDFEEQFASGVANQQAGGYTSWSITETLGPGTVYYWRVRLNNCDIGDPSSFVTGAAASEAVEEPYAYPNPSNPSPSEPVTFTQLPAGAQLTIMSVSGDIVGTWTVPESGEVQWNGLNGKNEPVSPGIYVWTLDPGGQGGKIMVKR